MDELRLKHGDTLFFRPGVRGLTVDVVGAPHVSPAAATFTLANVAEIRALEERLAAIRARLERNR